MSNHLQVAQKSHWRARIKGLVNNVKRIMHIGKYWYWLEPPELEKGINIASFVSPLRYDVQVRRDFFSFYATHRELYTADFNAFVDLVRQTSYYTWFEKSELIRCMPYLKGNSEGIWTLFLDRVHRAVALYENVMERGFTHQYPIILKTAERLLPPTTDRLGPPTGKIVSGKYFLADGCHRLGLLMSMGYTVLLPGYFRVQCFREFSPFDSTSLLAHSMLIEPSAYFAFLSSRYCYPFVFDQKADFLRYIKECKPDYLNEVLSIIRVDGFDG